MRRRRSRKRKRKRRMFGVKKVRKKPFERKRRIKRTDKKRDKNNDDRNGISERGKKGARVRVVIEKSHGAHKSRTEVVRLVFGEPKDQSKRESCEETEPKSRIDVANRRQSALSNLAFQKPSNAAGKEIETYLEVDSAPNARRVSKPIITSDKASNPGFRAVSEPVVAEEAAETFVYEDE